MGAGHHKHIHDQTEVEMYHQSMAGKVPVEQQKYDFWSDPGFRQAMVSKDKDDQIAGLKQFIQNRDDYNQKNHIDLQALDQVRKRRKHINEQKLQGSYFQKSSMKKILDSLH